MDSFKTIDEVQEALRIAGLESCNLIVGIDYTKSNEYTGKLSFRGQCLHHIDADTQKLNPYQVCFVIDKNDFISKLFQFWEIV